MRRFRTAGIPSLEGIAISNHIKHSLVAGYFSSLNETRSIICSAFSVFIKYQPVSGRCIDGELHVASNCELSAVLVVVDDAPVDCLGLSIAGITADVALSVNRGPSFKVVGVVGDVAHVDRVCCFCFASRDLCYLSADGDSSAIYVCNGVLLEHCSIISDATIFTIKGCCFRHSICTNLVDSHEVSFSRIVLFSRPSFEYLTCRNCPCTGIVDDLLNFSSSISSLNVHTLDICCTVLEVYGQSRNNCLNYYID